MHGRANPSFANATTASAALSGVAALLRSSSFTVDDPGRPDPGGPCGHALESLPYLCRTSHRPNRPVDPAATSPPASRVRGFALAATRTVLDAASSKMILPAPPSLPLSRAPCVFGHRGGPSSVGARGPPALLWGSSTARGCFCLIRFLPPTLQGPPLIDVVRASRGGAVDSATESLPAW